MAVENPLYIHEFNEHWPDGLDAKSQGDDHIRNIKAALKRTFPKVTGATQATHKDMDKLITPGVTNVPGMIMMWPYGAETVPGGWKVCNGVGTLRDGRAVPDLRDRFVVGAGNSYPVASTGGTASHTPAVTVAAHAITVDEMPAHTHGTPQGHPWQGAGRGTYASGDDFTNTVGYWMPSKETGGGKPHTHKVSTTAVDHRPPYFALLFIIKD